MRSVRIARFGGPEVLELVETETPRPGPEQVLVRVHSSGVNFADTLMRQNRYALTPELPSVLGHEAAGEIVAVGPGVDGGRIGERVAAALFAAGSYVGGYGDHLVIDADYAVGLPDDIRYETATALMVQGLTALHLTRQADPRGRIVLVNAAAGGVGSLLIQLARRAGAKRIVAAASSPEKLALAESLGADSGVNYSKPDWLERLRETCGGSGPDVVYESAGGAVTMSSLAALAPKGEIVVYGALNIQSFHLGVPELLGLIFKNQSLKGFALAPLLTAATLRTGLGELFDLVRAGRLTVTLGGTYPLERAADAHRALEDRRTSGKLLLVA
jgi:NADPH2:quinone reductase